MNVQKPLRFEIDPQTIEQIECIGLDGVII